jgi:hypothetical protein
MPNRVNEFTTVSEDGTEIYITDGTVRGAIASASARSACTCIVCADLDYEPCPRCGA